MNLCTWVPEFTDSASCAKEISARIGVSGAVLSKLKAVWKSKDIKLETKRRLMEALVWPVTTYGCEAWTLRKSEEKKLEAFEMRCWRKMLRISWTEKKTNELVLKEVKGSC